MAEFEDLVTGAITAPIKRVFGQGTIDNFNSGAANYPSSSTGDTGLDIPIGLAFDSEGSLYVSDANNARVLKFAFPFPNAAGAPVKASAVFGQGPGGNNFTDKICHTGMSGDPVTGSSLAVPRAWRSCHRTPTFCSSPTV